MRRRATFIACATAVLALSACASSQRTPAVRPSPRPLTPKIAALRDPQTLLHRIAVPSGARPDPGLATGLLAEGWRLGVGAHRVWRVPLPYHAVVRFFRRQHPRGAVRASGTRIGSVRSFGMNRELDWSFPPIRPFLSSRRLSVTVVALSRTETGVRIAVEDVWRVRPTSERAPAGTRTITVHGDRSDGVAGFARRITQPWKVARVVRLFDALPLFRPSPVVAACALMRFAPPVVIMFLSGTGRVLAEAQVFGGGTGGPCDGTIVVTIHGRLQPMLAGTFLARVLALAGVPRRFGV